MLALFLKGLILGFSIAAPVGPIGFLCIKRSVHEGHLSGFITGCGAAAADGIYGAIAAFGLTAITQFLTQHDKSIQLIGGLFLLYLGIKTLTKKLSPILHPSITHTKFVTNFFSTCALTLANPMTITAFIAIFASLGLGSEHVDYTDAALLVASVFLGSLLWWLLLSTGIALFFKHKVTPHLIHKINILSGLIILGFGINSLFGAL